MCDSRRLVSALGSQEWSFSTCMARILLIQRICVPIFSE